jgi:hypothetical protein
MAFSEDLLVMKALSVSVTDDARTVIDVEGQMMNCAMDWQDQAQFEQLLARRIAS